MEFNLNENIESNRPERFMTSLNQQIDKENNLD